MKRYDIYFDYEGTYYEEESECGDWVKAEIAQKLLESLEDAIEQIYDNPILERKIEKALAEAKGE